MKIQIISFVLLLFLIGFTNYNSSNQSQPQNIILMIGDGMGLGQISAAMYANGGTLHMEKAKHIGLIKTNSASSIITDSAAGATAFSTGEKTYNKSINMDMDSPRYYLSLDIYIEKK